MKRFEKGFTLIELLVVVAIIGILATVVLASLGGARGRAQIAKVKAQLGQVPAAAAIYADSNGGQYSVAPVTDCSAIFIDPVSGMNNLTSVGKYPGTNPEIKCFADGSILAVSYSGSINNKTVQFCVDANNISTNNEAANAAPAAGTFVAGVCQ